MNLDKLTAEELEHLKTEINGCCDWCGAYVHCDRCEDPAVHLKMHSGEIDDPMDAAQGGHIHACCDEHFVFWTDAIYWTEHEDCEEGNPVCERRESQPSLLALLRDVRAGLREDATEEEKQFAGDIIARKVRWCESCDEWVPPDEMRPNTWDQGPPMCIDCVAENEIADPEMKEENQ